MTHPTPGSNVSEVEGLRDEPCISARDTFADRHGDWMQTFTGRRFWPLDPRPEEVCIEDIAHALSLQTRYGGHCLRFYSVAEHCVLLARAADREDALWLLLHDASEAYLSDMVRPLKRHMPAFREAEDRVAWAIYEAFDLDPGVEPAAVKALDNRILMDERAQVMRLTGDTWNYGGASEPLGITIKGCSPEAAEREFLALFSELTGRTHVLQAPAHVPAGLDREAVLRPMHTAPHGEPILAKHKPNQQMPKGWFATITLGHGDDEEPGCLDQILHYNGDRLQSNFHGMWEGWLPLDALSAATPPAPGVAGDAAAPDDWEDDPSADERWNAGLDYGQTQLCKVLGVDPQAVSWDAATETLDGDVRAVIGNILTARFGDDWRAPTLAPPGERGSDAVPAGWQTVPKEPTDEMFEEADRKRPLPEHYVSEVWSAMLDAAPKAPAAGGPA